MTTAFNDLLSCSNIETFKKFRENLINKRGNFSNGNFAKCQDLSMEKANNNEVKKIFAKKTQGSGQEDGFVFSNNGTMKAIHISQIDSPLKIHEDFSNLFRFENTQKEQLWKNVQDRDKKKLISFNLMQMIKKTDVNYRTLGDRCHYFVVGKVIITERGETGHYPLFLFPCEHMDEKKQIIKVDINGFINFWVDTYKLTKEISRQIGDAISMDWEFNAKLVDIQHSLNNLNIPLRDIQCDCTFSSISIVTGFETEYLDPAWKNIFQEK
jgi:hypothetical protein